MLKHLIMLFFVIYKQEDNMYTSSILNCICLFNSETKDSDGVFYYYSLLRVRQDFLGLMQS